jgi:hypothetical protein
MYVCTLKVAGEQHGITAQAQRGGIVDFGSQNSASIDRGGRGGNGGNNGALEQQGMVEESEDSSEEEDEDE